MGEITAESRDRMKAEMAAGPPHSPLRDLVRDLRAERERLGLTLTDVSERSGIDRAAIHKVEIMVNKNPIDRNVEAPRRPGQAPDDGHRRPARRAGRPVRPGRGDTAGPTVADNFLTLGDLVVNADHIVKVELRAAWHSSAPAGRARRGPLRTR